MKKIILMFMMISMTSFSGMVLKLGVGYTDYSTPTRINKDGSPSLFESSRRALNIAVPLELGYEYHYFKNKFGVIGSFGTELMAGYGKVYNSKAKEEKQRFIPGYIGINTQLNVGYKLSDDIIMRVGGKVGLGANIFYFFGEESKTGGVIAPDIIPGYELPFAGVIGFQFDSFIIELEAGAKYMFAEGNENIGNIISIISGGNINLRIHSDVKNPFSYNTEAENATSPPKYKNKLVFNTGLKIGFVF